MNNWAPATIARIEMFLPELSEYVDGYAPGWNREAIVESPQQCLQADTHAILKTAYEILLQARITLALTTAPNCGNMDVSQECDAKGQ